MASGNNNARSRSHYLANEPTVIGNRFTWHTGAIYYLYFIQPLIPPPARPSPLQFSPAFSTNFAETPPDRQLLFLMSKHRHEAGVVKHHAIDYFIMELS